MYERWHGSADLKFLDKIEIDVDESSTKTVQVPLPLRTRKNGTLFLHTFLTKRVYGFNWHAAIDDPTTTYTLSSFTEYLVPRASTFNLLHEKNLVLKL